MTQIDRPKLIPSEGDFPRLGVNIDHIATLRQLRGTPYPHVLKAGQLVEKAGAHQVTVHLREDRRHIQDMDVIGLVKKLKIPINLEMAVDPKIVRFARKLKPKWACLVPEKRKEVTTEGGLDLKKQKKKIIAAVKSLKKAGIKVSLFIEPSLQMVKLASEINADAVEFHTGKYCLMTQSAQGSPSKKPSKKAKKNKKVSPAKIKEELARLKKAALLAKELGLRANAGHGLDYQNTRAVVELGVIEEFNIGHSIICRSTEVGLRQAVEEMASIIVAP